MWSGIRRHPLIAILAAAFVLRLILAVGVQYQLDHVWKRQFVVEGDANGYWELGEKLARGEPYELYTPPRRVLRMPGFPLFLAAGIKLSGGSPWFARLMLVGTGTAACGMVYLLGRELSGPTVGQIAAAICAVLPAEIGFSALLLSETLFAMLLAGSLVLMARLLRRQTEETASGYGVGLSLGIGVAIAAACYVRPGWLLFAPAFVVVLLLLADRKRTALLQGGLIMAALIVSLLPWAARNHHVTGHWVFTTLWVGPSLYDGLHEGATGASDMRFFDRDQVLNRMSEYQMDRHYRSLAWQFVREHPARTLQLAGVKLTRYWSPWPLTPQFDSWLLRLPLAISFLALIIAAIVGGWHARRDLPLLILTAGPILYFAAIHSLFVGSMRYRLPAEYPLCVLAALGLHAWFRASGTTAGQPTPTTAGSS